jgi:hypothetical protein
LGLVEARGVEATEGGGDVVTHVAPGRSSGVVMFT